MLRGIVAFVAPVINVVAIALLFKVGCAELALAMAISRTFASMREGWRFRVVVTLTSILVFVLASRQLYSEDPLLSGRGAYEVLGLTAGATQKEIGRAYRTIASHMHPDKISHEEENYAVVLRAYEAIRQPFARIIYDKLGVTGCDLSSPTDVVRLLLSALLRSLLPYLKKLLLQTTLSFVTWSSAQIANTTIVAFSMLHLSITCHRDQWEGDPAFVCAKKLMLLLEVILFLINVNTLCPKQTTKLRNWRRSRPTTTMTEVSRGDKER